MNASTILDCILDRLENRATRLHNVTREKARLVSESLTVDRKMCSLMAELEAVKAESDKMEERLMVLEGAESVSELEKVRAELERTQRAIFKVLNGFENKEFYELAKHFYAEGDRAVLRGT